MQICRRVKGMASKKVNFFWITLVIFLHLGTMMESRANILIDSSETSTRVFEIVNHEQKSLGIAPVSISDSLQGRVFLLEKKGFVPATIPFYQNTSGDTQITVKLNRINDWMPEENDRNTIRLAETITDSIYEVQALLETGNIKEGLMKAEELRLLNLFFNLNSVLCCSGHP